MQTQKKQEFTEVSWRNNMYNTKFGVETRLEQRLPIEYTNFQ